MSSLKNAYQSLFAELQTLDDLKKFYPEHILKMFPVGGKGPFAHIADKDWYSWQWQLQNRITNIEQLSQYLNLSADEKKGIINGAKRFKMSITPYYLALMDKDDPTCPIRMQAVPSSGELKILKTDLEDPVGEEKMMPVKGITHRYPDRVLFYASFDCPLLCRHCTRKRKAGDPKSQTSNEQIDACIAYIEKTKTVRDVVVSGGDPLCLGNERIDYILTRLREIPHVEVVRIGTRNPVTNPIRLWDDELLAVLTKGQPVHVNTHYNHPKEMTREALFACTRLNLAQCQMGNQSVLLKGVNDDAKIFKDLVHRLLMMKVRPYYIYQCDMAQGISHFRTSIDKGVEIIENLRGWTSGLAIPQFVVDAPGGGGKIPINPQYFIQREGQRVTLRNFEKKLFEYYEPDFASEATDHMGK